MGNTESQGPAPLSKEFPHVYVLGDGRVKKYPRTTDEALREILASFKLQGVPHVMPLLATGYDTKCKKYTLYTPHQPHGDLYDYMMKRNRKMTEEEAQRIIKPILNMLIRVHAMHLFHNDLALEQVFYNPETHQVLVGDWGFFGPEEKKGYKLDYRSPPGVINDIYAVGIMYFGLRNNWLPFCRHKGDPIVFKSEHGLKGYFATRYCVPMEGNTDFLFACWSKPSPSAASLLQRLSCSPSR